MRVRADRWWWGLPLLAALWWGMLAITEPRLDADLSAGAKAVVAATAKVGAEPWLAVEVAGRDLVATGEAPSPQALTEALERLASLPGVRRIDDRTGVIATPRPFLLSVTRAENRIAIEGFRPAEVDRQTFDDRLRAAVPADIDVGDTTRAGSGAPEGFTDAAAILIAELARLGTGSATIRDRTVSVSGAAPDPDAYNSVREALRKLPPGFVAGSIEVEPPVLHPYRWSAERRGEDGALLLGGYVPSEQVRLDVVASAERIAPGLVYDRMQTARGVPAGVDYGATVRFALGEVGELLEGVATLNGAELALRGAAVKGALDEIRASLDKGLPPGLTRGPLELRPAIASPYRFTARRTADSVVLEGYYPDERARESILKLVRPRFFGEAILDRGRLADGAPARFVEGVGLAVEQLSYLAAGEASLTGTALTLRGESLYPQTAERMREIMTAAAPPGWTVDADVRVRPPGPPGPAKP